MTLKKGNSSATKAQKHKSTKAQKHVSSRIGVQYKKVTSLVIISLAIEHTDLMSNVELRSFVLVLFGNICACYKNWDQLNDLKNLYQMAEFLPSTFIIPCSTFDIKKSYPFNVLYLITFLYCTRRIVNHSINIKLFQELQSTQKFKSELSFITIRCIDSMQKNARTTPEADIFSQS